MSFIPDSPRRRAVGPRAIGRLAAPLVRPAAQRYGFAAADLLACWPAIAGERIAACALPERLSGRGGHGVLTLRVTPARALDIEYAKATLLARIAAALGPGAVSTIRIVQGPVAPRPPAGCEARTAKPPREAGLSAALQRLSAARGVHGHGGKRPLSEG